MRLAAIWKRLGLDQPSSFARRAIIGAGWTGTANLLTRAMAFASMVFVARVLGKEPFGRFGIISSTITSFTTVGALGMGVAATKLVAQHRSSRPELAARSLASCVAGAIIAGAIVAALLLAFAPFVAARWLDDPALASELRVAAIALFFLSWASAQGGALLGLEAFSTFAKCNVAVAVAQLGFVSAGAHLLGLSGAVQGLAAAAAAQCLLQSFALRHALTARGISASLLDARRELPRALQIGVPAMLSAGIVLPTLWACSALLVSHAGYEHMAVITIADQWFNFVLLIPSIGAQVLLPLLTGVFAEESETQQGSLIRRLSALHALLGAACLIVLVPISPLIMRLYGATYAADWPVLAVLVAAGCVAAAVSPAGYALTATGRLWLAFAMNLGWSVAYVGGAYALVAVLGHGALGLAAARFGAYVLHAAWSFAFVRALVLRGRRSVDRSEN